MRRCQTFADDFQASGHRELKEFLLLVFVPTVHVHKLVDQSCDSHKLSLTAQAMPNAMLLQDGAFSCGLQLLRSCTGEGAEQLEWYQIAKVEGQTRWPAIGAPY